MAEKSKLDIAANIAILVVCALAVALLIPNIRDRYFRQQPARPPEVKAGEQIAALGKIVPAGTERALVVALSPTCHFCTESMPFYKRLIDERNQGGSNVKVIAAVPTPAVQAEETAKLSAAGVKPDAIVAIDFVATKVPGTPTIFLVDKQGKVLNVWVGKQSEGGEREILATL